MTLLSDTQAINSRLAQTDPTYGIHDRGQFYIEQVMRQTTSVNQSNHAAMLEGHISTFSGTAGGNAFAANYLLADWGRK